MLNLQLTGILFRTIQQYGCGQGQGMGTLRRFLVSDNNLELIQFEIQPKEGFVHLWKSYSPKIHFVLAW